MHASLLLAFYSTEDVVLCHLAYHYVTLGTMYKCLDGVQAGGYFSICVCITTWWLAIAELVFDVTGKVGLPRLTLAHLTAFTQ